MLRAKLITWVGELSEEDKKYEEKWGHWRNYATIAYTYQLNGSTFTGYMTEHQYKVYLCEVEIIDQLKRCQINHDDLLVAIKRYGDESFDAGYAEASNEYAELEARDSL